jgi:hypothetical protein
MIDPKAGQQGLPMEKIRSSDDTSQVIDPNPKDITDFKSKTFFFSRNCPNQCICYEFKRYDVICTNHSIVTHRECGAIGIRRPPSRIIVGTEVVHY